MSSFVEEEQEFFETRVFPDLKIALTKLTEQILKTDEVKKHKERLKETQVLDKLKEKDIENEKLRLELGSDYESSSDSSIFEDLDFKISEKSNEDDPDIYESGFIDISKKNEWLMGISSENEPEKKQTKKSFDKNDRKRFTQILLKKKEEKLFNPLRYLGLMLKEMNQLNNNNGINQISPSKLKRKTVKIVEESNQNIKKKSEDGSSP